MKAIHTPVILALTLLLSLPAVARDWYVSAAGTGDGLTSGSPTQNLVAVCAALAAGDNVYLNGADSFTGPGAINVARILMTSYGAGMASITNREQSGTTTGLTLTGADNCTLTNLRFACNNNTDGTIWHILVSGARTVTIVNCTLETLMTAASGDWRQHGGISAAGTCLGWTIRGCQFLNIARNAATMQPDYRMYLLSCDGAAVGGLTFAHNVVSQYEGVVITGNSGSQSYRLSFVSNLFINCLAQTDQNGMYSPFSRNGWQPCSYDVSYNCFFNNTNYTPFAALTARRAANENGQQYDVFMNNTFFGFAMITTNVAGASINQFYNNIIVKAPTQASLPAFFAAATSYNLHDYTVWSGQSDLTNAGFSIYVSTHSTNYDIKFASLDPSSPDFLRPKVSSAPEYDYLMSGYGGAGIGAVLPPMIPEPWAVSVLVGMVALLRGRRS